MARKGQKSPRKGKTRAELLAEWAAKPAKKIRSGPRITPGLVRMPTGVPRKKQTKKSRPLPDVLQALMDEKLY